MDKYTLNHPDLNQEQLRNFTKRINSALVRLNGAHRIVIEEIFDNFKDNLSAISRRKTLTLISHLDDAIASSVKLRTSLFEDLKYHIECEKHQKREARKRKKQAMEDKKNTHK